MSEKPKKPTIVKCKYCNYWIADLSEDGLPCPWCSLKVAFQKIDDLQVTLKAIRNNNSKNSMN